MHTPAVETYKTKSYISATVTRDHACQSAGQVTEIPFLSYTLAKTTKQNIDRKRTNALVGLSVPSMVLREDP